MRFESRLFEKIVHRKKVRLKKIIRTILKWADLEQLTIPDDAQVKELRT